MTLTRKSEVLEYLRENGFPTPKIYGTLDLGDLTRESDDLILRSDLSGEVCGFEGLFDSPVLKFRTDEIKAYCEGKGLDLEEHLRGFGLIVQEYLPYPVIGRMYIHPHDDNRFFGINFGLHKFFSQNVKNGANERDERYFSFTRTGSSPTIDSYVGDTEIDIKLRNFLETLVKTYEEVTSLPEFSDGYSWEMEYGLGLGVLDVEMDILQLRRFRPKKRADFELDLSSFDPERRIVTDTVFGITPEEGVTVNYLNTEPYIRKFLDRLEMTEGKDLLVSPYRNNLDPIPSHLLWKISTILLGGKGVLFNHGEFREAKDVPYLFFSGKARNWIYRNVVEAENLSRGGLKSFKLYSDGRHGVLELV